MAKEAAAPVAAAAAAEGAVPAKVDFPDRDAFERKVQALKDFMKANKAEKDAIQKRIEGNKSSASSGAAVSEFGAGAILGHVSFSLCPGSPSASLRARGSAPYRLVAFLCITPLPCRPQKEFRDAIEHQKAIK